MTPLLLSALVGFVLGPIGSLVAALLGATVLRGVSEATRGALLAFAGGFILSAAFVEMLGRGLATDGSRGLAATLAGLAAGAAARGVLTWWLDRRKATTGDTDDDQSGQTHARREARQLAISLAVVNVLEGLPVGVGFAVGRNLGYLIGAIMVFENFTEALSVTTELDEAGEHSRSTLLWLPTVPTATLGIGAIIGAWLGGLSPLVLAGLLGCGAGIMLHAVLADMIFDAHRLGKGPLATAALFLGIIVAATFSWLG